MNTITVELGERSYPIHIGENLLGHSQLYSPHINGPNVVVVTNDIIAPLYLSKVEAALQDIAKVHTCIIPDGEVHKTLDTVNEIFDKMFTVPCGRDTTLIALGGGIVGDVAGFAAACYQRGISFIQIPTTLLAQVDSSVGGKTGVNHSRGKNMIGAFYQPQCVIADIDTLRTLPIREIRAGVAEIIKYGAIRNTALFNWLEKNIEDLVALDTETICHAVEQSCKDKAAIVAEDERESGVRAILNFGHTFGHAIETAVDYKDWLHGEAVAVGMSMAADFSRRLELLSLDEVVRIDKLIRKAGLPAYPPPNITPEMFLELMKVDKKVLKGQLRLIALNGIGNAIIVSENHMDALNGTLKATLMAA